MSGRAIRHSNQCANTPMRAEQNSAERATDLPDRSLPVVLQKRWSGLTNKSHTQCQYPCPARGRTKMYDPEIGWSEVSTCERCQAQQCHQGCRRFAARLVARQL